MTADYAALEARVAELEQQMRQILPAKIDAVSYGLSLVHEDTRAIRETLDRHGAILERMGNILEQHEILLTRQGELLKEILLRLPT
jgi:hypothetical protein